MSSIREIEKRLARLERQKGYIFGMWLAERAHSLGICETKGLQAMLSLFRGEDPSLVKKGYRAQETAIGRRLAKEQAESRNLFTIAG